MKICSKCLIQKDLSSFRRDKTRKDGLSYVCKDCKQQNDFARYWSNPEKQRNRGLQSYWKNPEKNRANARVWKKCNPAKVTLSWLERKEIKEKSQNMSLSSIQLAQIEEFYDIAIAKTTQTGILHHVDHIHPLRGNGFNGLHVPWNLQVLTAEENMKKGRRVPSFDEFMMWSN